MTKVFNIMTTKPAKGNPYFNTTDKGGYSQCVKGKCSSTGKPDPDCNVLANCVGFACGDFNRIYSEVTGYKGMKYPKLYCNAENFIEVAKNYGLTISQKPSAGAIAVWMKGATLSGSDGAGHVCTVQRTNADFTEFLSAESGWNSSSFWNSTRTNKNGKWGAGSGYTFRGFIINPAIGEGVTNLDDTPSSPVETEDYIIYTVKQGDTLSGIGAKYGMDYKVIASYNGISNPNLIHVGQQIKIPKNNVAPAPTPVPTPSTPTTTEITYTVKKGDTLSGIGAKYGVDYKVIAEYNGIKNPNVISVGQVIKIPVSGATVPKSFSVGDKVTITGKYAASSGAKTAKYDAAKGKTRYIVKIHSGKNFPYQLGAKKGDISSSNTTGFANDSGIKKA